jgi:hypothetical protein
MIDSYGKPSMIFVYSKLYPSMIEFADHYDRDLENVRTSKKSLTAINNDTNNRSKESNNIVRSQ